MRIVSLPETSVVDTSHVDPSVNLFEIKSTISVLISSLGVYEASVERGIE